MANTPSGSSPPAQTHYQELTLATVLLGVIQGVLLNVAFTYIALKIGLTLSGSAIAAITGFVILRVLLRSGTIIENNLNQTIASAINSTGTGVVFVLPALFLLSNSPGEAIALNLVPMLLAGCGGTLLGILMIIPLRRQMIEVQRLRFPSGMAVATVLRSGSHSTDKARLLGMGFLIGCTWKLIIIQEFIVFPGVLEGEQLDLSFGLIPAWFALTIQLSPLNFAAGLLSGRGGLPFLLGGIVAWWIISPATVLLGWTPGEIDGQIQQSQTQAEFIFIEMLRPLGIGIMIGAACSQVLTLLPLLRCMMWSMIQILKNHRSSSTHELPLWALLGGSGIAILLQLIALWMTPDVTLIQSLLVAVIGTLWMGLAVLIVSQATGLTDISPVSGMALISISLMMMLLDNNVFATLMVSLAISTAIVQGADMMQDLKTGFMVGSNPRTQQWLQISFAWLGVPLSCGIIYLLWQSGQAELPGFGPGTTLPAPQATVLTSIIDSIQADSIPSGKLVMGSIVGVLLGLAPVGALGILTGLAMYLPFAITLGYGLGCLTQMWIERQHGTNFVEHKLVPLAAGLIIGEALTSVTWALYEILGGFHMG